MHNFQNSDFVVVFTMFSSAGLPWGWSKIKEGKTVCASMLNCKATILNILAEIQVSPGL